MGPLTTIIGSTRVDRRTSEGADSSDEATLIRAAQAGDPTALEILTERHSGLVRKLGRRYFLPGQEREDLMQEGIIGLLQGIRSYDRRLDPSFSNHLARCVLNHLVAAVRKATRKRQRLLNEACSLEESGMQTLRDGADTEDMVLHRLALDDTKQRMERLLSPHERRVLAARAMGYSQSEISSLVGLSPKQVENSLYRARTKIRSNDSLEGKGRPSCDPPCRNRSQAHDFDLESLRPTA